jgi:hypothetical protein
MAWEKQVVLTGDVITADWGNHIQDQYKAALRDLANGFLYRFLDSPVLTNDATVWDHIIAVDRGARTFYLGKSGTVSFARYDVDSDSITVLADLPSALSTPHCGCGLFIGDTLYFFNRAVADSNNMQAFTYNKTNNTWSNLASYANTSASVSPGRVPLAYDGDDHIFVGCPSSIAGWYTAEIYRYKISTNAWLLIRSLGQHASFRGMQSIFWHPGFSRLMYVQYNGADSTRQFRGCLVDGSSDTEYTNTEDFARGYAANVSSWYGVRTDHVVDGDWVYSLPGSSEVNARVCVARYRPATRVAEYLLLFAPASTLLGNANELILLDGYSWRLSAGYGNVRRGFSLVKIAFPEEA